MRGCPAGRGWRRHEDTVGCSCRTDVWDAQGQRGAGAKLGEQHEACSSVGWLQDEEGDTQRKRTGWKGAQQDIRCMQVCVHPAWKCRVGAGHAGVQVDARGMVTRSTAAAQGCRMGCRDTGCWDEQEARWGDAGARGDAEGCRDTGCRRHTGMHTGMHRIWDAAECTTGGTRDGVGCSWGTGRKVWDTGGVQSGCGMQGRMQVNGCSRLWGAEGGQAGYGENARVEGDMEVQKGDAG